MELRPYPHGLETQQTLNDLCEEYKDTFSLHQGDIGHTKLLAIDIDKGYHHPIALKPYTLQLKHTQWVCEEIEMLKKLYIFQGVFILCLVLLLLC